MLNPRIWKPAGLYKALPLGQIGSNRFQSISVGLEVALALHWWRNWHTHTRTHWQSLTCMTYANSLMPSMNWQSNRPELRTNYTTSLWWTFCQSPALPHPCPRMQNCEAKTRCWCCRRRSETISKYLVQNHRLGTLRAKPAKPKRIAQEFKYSLLIRNHHDDRLALSPSLQTIAKLICSFPYFDRGCSEVLPAPGSYQSVYDTDTHYNYIQR